MPFARREGGSGCTLLGSLALWSCPGAGALAGVAIDPVSAGSPILTRAAGTLINVLCTIVACPACIAQAEIARDHCLQIEKNQINCEHESHKEINGVGRKTDVYTSL